MFYALDARSGKIMWSYDISRDGNQKSFHGRMFISDSLVIIGTDVPAGHVYAFERFTGRVRWKYDAGPGVHGDIRCSGERVYALTSEDRLVCFDRESGEVQWEYQSESGGGRWNDSSPELSGDRVFFRGIDSFIYTLDARTGGLIWKREIAGNIRTSVSFRKGGVYAGSSSDGIVRLDGETGDLEASLPLESSPYGTLTFAGGTLLFFTGERGLGRALVAAEPGLGRITWMREAPEGSTWTTYRPHIWDGTAVVGNSKGVITAFRLSDGAELWSFHVTGTLKTIGRSHDTLFIGVLEGSLFAYRIGGER